MDYRNYKKVKTEGEGEVIVNATLPDHIIFDTILNRFPTERLMGCKIVSKEWYHTITQDQDYIHFLLSRSRKHEKVFIEQPLVMEDPRNGLSVIKRGAASHCFVIGDVIEGNCELGRAAYICAMSTSERDGMTPFCYIKHPGAVNGLTCFCKYYEPDSCVCVFNVSTREVTPWVRSRVKHGLRMHNLHNLKDDLGFGYSPATKESKLLWKWCTPHASNMNNAPDGNVKEVWEVLTVGQNTWRVIQDVIPFFVGRNAISTHVNGTIYWLPETGDDRYVGNLSLAAFDVSTEKFKKIEIESFDHGPAWDDEFGQCIHLLEVDGAVTVLRRMNEGYAMLWKYNESNSRTTREILKFPERWTGDCQYWFHTGFELNHVIVELHQGHELPRLFSCNLRNWALFREIQVNDWDFPRVDDVPGSSLFTFFSESLLRLSKGKGRYVHEVSASRQAAEVIEEPSPEANVQASQGDAMME